MNLYFNTDSLNFVNGSTDFSPVSNLNFIFGASQNIGVTLVSANNGEYVMPSGYNFVLGLKPVGTYLTGNYLAYGSANQVPNTGAGNYAYNITGFNLYTTGISGLLAQNSSITLAMELEYDNNGSGVVLSNPNTVTINNSYINLDQTPFISGALAAYPAPNNIQTISNLGVTYVGTNQTGIFQPSGHYQPSGNYVTTSQTGTLYPASNPSGFSSVSVTGSNPVAGVVAFSGIGGTQVSLNGAVVTISGAGGSYGDSNYQFIFGATTFTGSINTVVVPSSANAVVFVLPTSGLSDGGRCTIADMLGPGQGIGLAAYPVTVSGSSEYPIYFQDTSNAVTQVLSRNYQIQTYTFIGDDIAEGFPGWYASTQYYQMALTGVLSAGSCTITYGAISTSANVSASHLCTSTGNRGALYVSALSAGSVTISSTNAADSDSISLICQ